MVESRIDIYHQKLIEQQRAHGPVASIRPLGTMSPEEAEQHWKDKAAAEEAEAEEAEAADKQAKVVRAPKTVAAEAAEAETK